MEVKETKTFTIKGARFTDIEAFNNYKDEHGFTQGKTFQDLMEGKFTNATQANQPPVNHSEAIDLAKFTELEQENQRLLEANRVLTLREEELTSENSTLKTEFAELKATLEQAPVLGPDDFIISPGAEMAAALEKIKSRLRLDKIILPGEKYPEQFTIMCTELFLKENYSQAFDKE